MPIETLCLSCEKAIFCKTWGEYKCLARETRLYEPVTECSHYIKDTREKMPDCGCKTCVEHGHRYEDDA